MRRWALLPAAVFSSSLCFSQDANLCAACHGAGGNSTTAGVPSIAAQPKLFIENQLILFREGVRVSAEMQAATKGLNDAQIVALAEHFARLPAKPAPAGPADKARFEQGRSLAGRLRCGSCHLPDFAGQAQIPRLAWQREEYLVDEMKAYRDNKRSGGDSIMAAALHGVSDAEISALGHFLSRSAPRSAARAARKGPGP